MQLESRKIGSNTQTEEAPDVMITFQKHDDTDKDLKEYIEKRIHEIEGDNNQKKNNIDDLLNQAKNRDEMLGKRDDQKFLGKNTNEDQDEDQE